MCVGDEDGSEAVGDAQQVRFFFPLSQERKKTHTYSETVFKMGFYNRATLPVSITEKLWYETLRLRDLQNSFTQ